MHPDSIVFDLDGTLWDTTATCADAWNRVLARLGIAYRTITPADVRAVTGQPHIDGIRCAFPDLSPEDVGRVAAETATEDTVAIAAHGGALYPGVREHLPALGRLLPLCIVSNCQQGYIETFLAWSRLGESFVDVECWGNTGDTKAGNLRSVIARNRLRRPLFVGDTDGDRVAAADNGVAFVYASYGFGQVARYDYRIDRFTDLPPLVTRSG